MNAPDWWDRNRFTVYFIALAVVILSGMVKWCIEENAYRRVSLPGVVVGPFDSVRVETGRGGRPDTVYYRKGYPPLDPSTLDTTAAWPVDTIGWAGPPYEPGTPIVVARVYYTRGGDSLWYNAESLRVGRIDGKQYATVVHVGWAQSAGGTPRRNLKPAGRVLEEPVIRSMAMETRVSGQPPSTAVRKWSAPRSGSARFVQHADGRVTVMVEAATPVVLQYTIPAWQAQDSLHCEAPDTLMKAAHVDSVRLIAWLPMADDARSQAPAQWRAAQLAGRENPVIVRTKWIGQRTGVDTVGVPAGYPVGTSGAIQTRNRATGWSCPSNLVRLVTP